MCNQARCPHILTNLDDNIEFMKQKLQLLNSWHDDVNQWRGKIDKDFAVTRNDIKWVVRFVVGLGSMNIVTSLLTKILGG